MNLKVTNILSIGFLVGLIQLLVSMWRRDRLAQAIMHEYDRMLGEYRFEMRRGERATRVFRLIALNYRPSIAAHKFNELAWELGLWLPADLVRELFRCLCRAEGATNPKHLLIAIRRQLHPAAADLTAGQIVHREDLESQAELTDSLIKNLVARSLPR